MRSAIRQRFRLSGGTELSFVTAGDESNPVVLLLHGFPSSARTFRDVVPGLSHAACVIAPDLPGFGESDVLASASFAAFGQAISEVLHGLGIGPRYIYLHDFGAPVGFHIAMQAPELVSGLIIQNANAHRTGFGPAWAATLAYWSQPNEENEAAATAHLTFEGTRDQYLAGVPPDVAAGIPDESWIDDWRVMCLRVEWTRRERSSPTMQIMWPGSARSPSTSRAGSRHPRCFGGGMMRSSTSPRSCRGCEPYRAWKLTSLTPAISSSRRTQARQWLSWSISSGARNWREGPRASSVVTFVTCNL
jgi:pimeloyl-ACP methyl ester carboxylesterase